MEVVLGIASRLEINASNISKNQPPSEDMSLVLIEQLLATDELLLTLNNVLIILFY